MDLARYVVDAVVVDNRSVRDVARAHGVSKSWVAVLVARYRRGGYDALQPRSKRPFASPGRVADGVEDRIIEIRLSGDGFDAGAHTIHHHLAKELDPASSVSTIWRVLKRRGFIVPEPKKQPKSSFIRFEAALPNECWQSDIERHEALVNREEVRDLLLQPVAAGW